MRPDCANARPNPGVGGANRYANSSDDRAREHAPFNFRLPGMSGGGADGYYVDRRNLHSPDGLSGTCMRPNQPLA
jgi:hypothetical protein